MPVTDSRQPIRYRHLYDYRRTVSRRKVDSKKKLFYSLDLFHILVPFYFLFSLCPSVVVLVEVRCAKITVILYFRKLIPLGSFQRRNIE
jgi:hypothetical protein